VLWSLLTLCPVPPVARMRGPDVLSACSSPGAILPVRSAVLASTAHPYQDGVDGRSALAIVARFRMSANPSGGGPVARTAYKTLVTVSHAAFGSVTASSRVYQYWVGPPDATRATVVVCAGGDSATPGNFGTRGTGQVALVAACQLWQSPDASASLVLPSGPQGFAASASTCRDAGSSVSGSGAGGGGGGAAGSLGFGLVVLNLTDAVCPDASCLTLSAWLTSDDGCPVADNGTLASPVTSQGPMVYFPGAVLCSVLAGCGPASGRRSLTAHVRGTNPATGLQSSVVRASFVVHMAPPQLARGQPRDLNVTFNARERFVSYASGVFQDVANSTADLQYSCFIGLASGGDQVARRRLLGAGATAARGIVPAPQAAHGDVHYFHLVASDRFGLTTTIVVPFAVDYTPPTAVQVSPHFCRVGVTTSDAPCLSVVEQGAFGGDTRRSRVEALSLSSASVSTLGACWASVTASHLGFQDIEQESFARASRRASDGPGPSRAAEVMQVGLRVVRRSFLDAFGALGMWEVTPRCLPLLWCRAWVHCCAVEGAPTCLTVCCMCGIVCDSHLPMLVYVGEPQVIAPRGCQSQTGTSVVQVAPLPPCPWKVGGKAALLPWPCPCTPSPLPASTRCKRWPSRPVGPLKQGTAMDP
jgi:hypothetical protein